MLASKCSRSSGHQKSKSLILISVLAFGWLGLGWKLNAYHRRLLKHSHRPALAVERRQLLSNTGTVNLELSTLAKHFPTEGVDRAGNSTPIKAKNRTKDFSPRLQDTGAANSFYQHHLDRITTLINASTALNWDARNKTRSFGPFLDLLDNPYVVPKRNQRPNVVSKSQYLEWEDGVYQAAKTFKNYHQQYKENNDNNNPPPSLPHVSVALLNENWGEFSAHIVGKTAKWSGFFSRWLKRGCRLETIMEYINHKDVRAVVTTQFQFDLDHPKVHSLPLGIKSWSNLELLLDAMKDSRPDVTTRPQLLMINSQPRSMREQTIATVIQNFRQHGLVLRNTYGGRYKQYLKEMRGSKFILSPGGIGLDCYRIWEALYMGTIPVIEHLNRKDGWFRTLKDLPVAWIDSHDNLSPEWLEEEYERIAKRDGEYKYEKLTKQWWFKMIEGSLE